MRYAGFWMRVVAFLVDLILTNLATIAVVFVAIALGLNMGQDPQTLRWNYNLVLGVISTVYHAALEASSMQGSAGKWILGLKVTDTHGNPVSFLRALGRNAAKLLSSLVLGLGYLAAAFTPEKQALHDMIAGCLVVRK